MTRGSALEIAARPGPGPLRPPERCRGHRVHLEPQRVPQAGEGKRSNDARVPAPAAPSGGPPAMPRQFNFRSASFRYWQVIFSTRRFGPS